MTKFYLLDSTVELLPFRFTDMVIQYYFKDI